MDGNWTWWGIKGVGTILQRSLTWLQLAWTWALGPTSKGLEQHYMWVDPVEMYWI